MSITTPLGPDKDAQKSMIRELATQVVVCTIDLIDGNIIPNSQAHVDFLMRKRVECLGKEGCKFMPGYKKKTGDIIDLHYYPMPWNENAEEWHIPEAHFGFIVFPSDYPHLFKQLPWYAKRKESELPKYVKFKNGEVVEWNDVIAQMVKYGDILPATQQEYDNQLNKTK